MADVRLYQPFAGTHTWYAHPAQDENHTPLEDLALFRGEITREPPRVRIARGRKADFLWYGIYVLISRKVVDVLSANSIAGWETHPVEVRDKNGVLLPGFYCWCILGRTGDILNPNSHYGEGVQLDMSKWDGSDIFLAGKTAMIAATEKVVNAMKKAKITGVEWVPIEKA